MGIRSNDSLCISNHHKQIRCFKLTKRLSGVRRTVTPASTLPTVRETSIVASVAANKG